jgi:hypothetical protein
MRRSFVITLLASCVTAIIGVASAGTANAATGTRATPANLVSCVSSNVWLRMWFVLGEDCYAGNGINLVNLTDVTREQIIGVHTVCLLTISGTRCATGPKTLTYQPGVSVREIEIRTP